MTEPEAVKPAEKPSQRFSHSDSIGELIGALAKAQLEFEAIKKETENPAYARGGKAMKYADLSTIIEATQPALAKNGIAILQSPDVEISDQSMTLTGLMAHSSGQWIRCETTLPAVQRDRFDPQSCGSSITYARRYQYKSLIGAAEEDDDANAASGIGSKAAASAVASQKAKAGKDRLDHAKSVDCLFYVFPESHNGHFAEIINLKTFGESLNEVQQDGLRIILKDHAVKGTAGGGGLVAADKVPDLLAALKECGVTAKELEAK